MIARPLTADLALALVPHLSARDRAEIMRTQPDLVRWARERAELPGVGWALEHAGTVLAIGGVVFQGETGALWLAGREGWTLHVKHALRIWRVIKETAGFKRLQCRVYADNPCAQRFAERAGFRRGAPQGDLISFEMVLS